MTSLCIILCYQTFNYKLKDLLLCASLSLAVERKSISYSKTEKNLIFSETLRWKTFLRTEFYKYSPEIKLICQPTRSSEIRFEYHTRLIKISWILFPNRSKSELLSSVASTKFNLWNCQLTTTVCVLWYHD